MINFKEDCISICFSIIKKNFVIVIFVISANNCISQNYSLTERIVNHRIRYFEDSIPKSEDFLMNYSQIVHFDSLFLDSILQSYFKRIPLINDDTFKIIIIETYKLGGNTLFGKIYSKYDTLDYILFYPYNDGVNIFENSFLSNYDKEINNWDSLLSNRSFNLSEILSWGGMIVTEIKIFKHEIVGLSTTGCYYHKPGTKICFLKERKEDNYKIRLNR